MDVLAVHASSRSDAPALIDDQPGSAARIVTFRELNEHANRVGNSLRTLGIRIGDKIRKRDLREPYWAGRETRV